MMTATVASMSENPNVRNFGRSKVSLKKGNKPRLSLTSSKADEKIADPVLKLCEEISSLDKQCEEISKKQSALAEKYGDTDEFYNALNDEGGSAAVERVKGFIKGSGYDELDELWKKHYDNAQSLRDKMLETQPLTLEGLVIQIYSRTAHGEYGDPDSISGTYQSIQRFFGNAPRNSDMVLTWLLGKIKCPQE